LSQFASYMSEANERDSSAYLKIISKDNVKYHSHDAYIQTSFELFCDVVNI